MGPEAAANLKADNDYIYQIEQSIKNVQDKDIVKQVDVDRAVAMKTEMENAKKIIDSWFSPKATTDWSNLGIVFEQLWLNANQNFAATLSWLDKILAKTKEIANVKPDNPENSIWTKLGDYFGGQNAAGISRMNDADRQFEAAKQRLGAQLGNSNNVTNNRKDLQRVDDWLTRDQSSPSQAAAEQAKKAQQELNDAVDRAINGLQRHVLSQQADADAVGKGAAALAGLRAEAIETAAKLANGGKETDDQAAKFAALALSASAAAEALTNAKIASDISRGQQLAFATPEDVQIANQLKEKYGDDIPRALTSSDAAALRLNNRMKDIGDTVRSTASAFANDFVSGILCGKSAMESLTGAANNLGKSLTTAGINNIIKDPASPVGWIEAGVGVITQLITGDSEKRKQEEAARKAAADVAAKAVQDGIDRTAAFNAQANAAQFDTSTVAGQISAFDQQAMQQRAAEAKLGNQAIVALENDLAKQRQAIIDKSNQAIAKSMNDFLNSIKTGASSILSPEDQLKYAQSKFNSDVTAGQGGDEGALNRITQDAQTLLDIAKGFYASSSGYATIYQSVTDAITKIASKNNISVNPLAPNDTQQFAAVGNQVPGMGGFAEGGIIGNGRYGIDSVMARFAGGGNVALAGGEAVTRASSVNSSTMGALSYINRTGKAPGNDNAEVVRVLTQGFNGLERSLGDRLEVLTDRVKRVEDATRQGPSQRRVAGLQKAA